MAAIARSSIIRNLQSVRSFSATSSLLSLEKAPIKVYGVEGRYAHALYSAAIKLDSLDVAEAEMKKVHNLLKDEEKLSEYCNDPTVNKLQKKDMIIEVLESQKFSELTVNFMGVVAEGNRLKRTQGIIRAFEKIMRARRGEVDCTITTAKTLDYVTNSKLDATLQKFVKATEILKIERKTDPALIGGMIINLGEYYIDMSTATKIKRISKALKGEK